MNGELNGQEIAEGEFANEKHVAHVVLTDDGREILMATDAYHIFYTYSTYVFDSFVRCFVHLFNVHIDVWGQFYGVGAEPSLKNILTTLEKLLINEL